LNRAAAIAFLQGQYNSKIGLFQEAPNAAPNNFWFFNDLYDAELAIGYVPGRAQYPRLPPPRVCVLGGQAFYNTTVLVPNHTVTVSTVGQNQILTEAPNLTAQPYDVSQYADIAFHNALNEFNKGNYTPAQTLLTQAEAMWDGTGWHDAPYNANPAGGYQTYKCALYLIALRILGVKGRFQAENQQVISNAQVMNRSGFANQQGGVSTAYTLGNWWAGDVNIETTSLCIFSG